MRSSRSGRFEVASQRSLERVEAIEITAVVGALAAPEGEGST